MLRSSDLTILCTSFLLGALMHSSIYSQSAPLVEEVVASPQVVTDERIPLLLRIPASVIAKSVDRDFHHTSPIQREILGTRSTGVAECHGAVTCELVEHSNANLTVMEEAKPINQDGVVVPIIWMGNMVTSNRALHGVVKA